MSNSGMEGFKKIRDLNLAELGDKPEEAEETLVNEAEETVDKELLSEGADATAADAAATKEKEEKAPEVYEPVGQHYVIDADITEEEIRNFLLGHTYRQPASLLIYVLALAILGYSVIRHSNVGWCFAFAVFIFAYMPVSTIMQAKTMKKKNPSFQQTFHYIIDEAGIYLKIGKESVNVEWKHFKKLMILKTVVVVYSGRNNGYIMPVKDMGSQKDEIIHFLKEKVHK